MEIKQMSKIKSVDAIDFKKLINFLKKYHSVNYGTYKNPLDLQDVICMILLKFQVICNPGGTEIY